MDHIKEAQRKVSNYIGVVDDADDEDLTITQQIQSEIGSICPSLSIKQRWYGFGICFCIGWFISFLSVIAVWDIKEHPGKFAFLYTCGSLIALLSTYVFIYICNCM